MIDKYFFTAFIEETLQKYNIKPYKDPNKYDIKMFCSSVLPELLGTKHISLKTNDKGTYIIITDVLPLYLEYCNNWSVIHSKMLKVYGFISDILINCCRECTSECEVSITFDTKHLYFKLENV